MSVYLQLIRYQPIKQECVITIPTNKFGACVQLAFSKMSHTIKASIVHQDGSIIHIKTHDIPKEFRKITNVAVFQSCFSNAFATVSALNNGDYSLHVFQRGRGGAPADNATNNLATETANLMAAGLNTIASADIKPHIIALAGRTGAGKSLLGNLLSDVEILGAPDVDGRYKFEPVSPIFLVSDSSVASCTKCPGFHSQQDYTFVDFPGFGDTHGAYQDTANAFFRGEVIKRVEHMKIVLVIPYEDIYQRGSYFSDTMTDLVQFLGCCQSEEGLRKAAAAIILVVTKVNPPRNNTTETQTRQNTEVKTRIEGHLGSQSTLRQEAKTLLRLILETSRWTIFNSPNDEGPCQKALIDKENILGLLANNAVYISKNDAEVQVKAAQRYDGEVLSSIAAINEELKTFASNIRRDLDAHITKVYEEDGEEAFKTLRTELDALAKLNSNCTLQEFLEIFTEKFTISEEVINEGKNKHSTLEFLVGLLPDAAANTAKRKRWFTELEMTTKLKDRVDMIDNILTPAAVSFTNHIMTVKGYFPKISQVKDKLRDSSVTGIQEIRVYGLNTVTFDEDLKNEKMAGIKFVVIAPKWVIQRHREVDLSGTNSTHIFASAAGNGASWGASGVPGSPGYPGNSGGNFLGIGHTFSNLNDLLIVSKGGRGSKGQKGGKGHDGQGGTDGKPETRPQHKGGVWVRVSGKDGNTNQHHVNPGTAGGVGGNGGEGGAGGKGGLAGTARLVSLSDEQAQLAKQLENGTSGDNGEAGDPGGGGVNGRTWEGVWYHRDDGWNGWHLPKYHGGGNAQGGSSPATKNSAGLSKPTAIAAIEIQLRNAEYIEYLTSASTRWTERALTQFQQAWTTRGVS